MSDTFSMQDIYDKALALFKQLTSGEISAHIQQQIESLVADILALYAKTPQLLQAQISIYKPKYPYIVNLTLNIAFLSLALSKQRNLAPSIIEYLLSAAFTCNLARIKKLNQQFKTKPDKDAQIVAANNPKLSVARLSSAGIKQKIWLRAVLESKELVSGKGLPNNKAQHQQLSCSQILSLCHYIAELITPTQYRKAQPLYAVLKVVLTSKPERYSRENIENLLRAFTVIPVGSLITINSTLAITLRKTTSGIVVQEIDANSKQPLGLLQHIEQQQVDKLYRPCSSNDENFWQRFADAKIDNFIREQNLTELKPENTHISDSFQPSEKISQLQIMLNHEQPDVKKISLHIDSDKGLSDELKLYANQLTKHDLEVKESTHALMLVGLRSAGFHLIFAALKNQLMNVETELANRLLTLITLRSHFAFYLADSSDSILPYQAASFALVASSGLIVNPAISHKIEDNKWKITASKSYRTGNLIDGIDADLVDKTSVKIAQGWQQPSDLRKSLQFSERLPKEIKDSMNQRKLHSILGTSNILTADVLCQFSWQQQGNKDFIEQSCDALKIPLSNIPSLIKTVTFQKHTLCPL